MFRKAALITIFALSYAAAANAQVPGGNIFFGYSFARADLGAANHTNLNGWNGSLEGKIFPFVGIVADVSGHYGTEEFRGFCTPPAPCPLESADASIYSALFGPRVSASVGKLRPFAHALLGVSHEKISASDTNGSDTAIAVALGGGIDYGLFPGLAWRVQADDLQTRFFSATQNNIRVSTGIVFRF